MIDNSRSEKSNVKRDHAICWTRDMLNGDSIDYFQSCLNPLKFDSRHNRCVQMTISAREQMAGKGRGFGH